MADTRPADADSSSTVAADLAAEMVETIGQEVAAKPTLLTLPAEIRNHIWGYTLPAETRITKEKPCPDIPPISLVCRQTFTETLSRFIKHTEFVRVVHDYDGSFCVTFSEASARISTMAARLKSSFGNTTTHKPRPVWHNCAVLFYLGGIPNWQNILAWAKAEHQYHAKWLLEHPDQDYRRITQAHPMHEVHAAVFNTMRLLGRLPWEMVEVALEEIHVLAKTNDARWA